MTRTARYGASHDAILDAAAGLIATKGVAGTSISDIVHASGTSAGAIYHHFSSKQDIVLAVAIRAIGQPVAIALTSTGPVSPAELFRLAADRVALEEATSAMLVQVWAGAAADPLLRGVFTAQGDGFYAGVAEHVTQWCSEHDQDPVVIAQLLVGAVIGLAVQRSVFEDFDRAAYVAQVVAMLDRLGADGPPPGIIAASTAVIPSRTAPAQNPAAIET